jgi:4-amino-4-deoxy-L-arabinose transferase-like glycosyltransferase
MTAAEAARPPFARAIVGALVALKLALHLLTSAITPYGFHRDEFLYLAMGRHLSLWRMDFPPGIALLAEIVRGSFGDSLFAIRLVPALAGCALVVLAALIARELGGGRFAQGLAALAVVCNTLFLRASSLFQPVVLDQVAWTLGLFALARLGRTRDERWWLVLGIAGGLGLLVKFSVLFFGFAVLVGLLLTRERAALATRWPWLALLVAVAIGSPGIVGQLQLGFPVVGQMRDLHDSQLARVTVSEFVAGQLRLGPTTLLALVGLTGLLVDRAFAPFRLLGWTCAAAFVTLLVLHGKPYYAGPVYPALFGAGAVLLARLRRPRLAPLLRWAAVALIVLYGGVVLLPLGLPILPPAAMSRYAVAVGATDALRTNRGAMAELPQDYADMLGWEEQVRAVALVYARLPPERQREAVLLGANYGEAGALEFYGPRYGLPPVVSPAGSFWHFGPGHRPGRVLVTIGVPADTLRRFYDSVAVAGRVDEPWVVSEERGLSIVVGSGARHTLQEVWPTLAGQQ